MEVKLRRLLGLLLAAAVLCLTLAGCGMSSDTLDELLYGEDTYEPEPTGEYIRPLAEGWWFDYSSRADVEYSDMKDIVAGPYDGSYAELFRSYRDGGEYEDFETAYFLAQDEVYRLYTYYTILDIEYTAEPTDEAAAAVDEAYARWYDAADELDAALAYVSGGAGAALIDEGFGEGSAERFAAYVSEGDASGDPGGYGRESELLHSYNVAMTQPEPDVEQAAEIFVELVELRNERAAAYGYSSCAEMEYYETFYRSYSPQDVADSVWTQVKEHFVPLVEEYGEAASAELLELYMAEDIDCSEESVMAALEYVAPRLSQDAAEALDYMRTYGLYDISLSGTKLNTGFTTTLYYFNEPYLFNAPMGDVDDYTDTFHEFGHFLNSYAVASDLLYGMPDTDLCELQSQGMEMMFTYWYEDVFGEKYAEPMRLTTVYDMLCSVVDGAMYDEFQQRVYAEPELSAARACEIYQETAMEYGRYAGDEGRYDWVYVSHNFDYPFYYISYCLSAIPALELYGRLQEDAVAAAELYMETVSLDPEVYYFEDALAECGYLDPFVMDSGAQIAEMLSEALSGLNKR